MLQFATSASAAGPFAALSLIAAPAILTNACALLVMSTSNRLARAVDFTRDTARELERTTEGHERPDTERRLRELSSAQDRSLLLVRALRAIYAALAGFATATLVSLLGVVFMSELPPSALRAVELVALVGGAAGVAGIVWASSLLVRETRIAAATMRERVAAQQRRFASA